MLTGRAALKCGLVAAGAALLPSKATRSYADVSLPNLQLTPFMNKLPLLPDYTPVERLDPLPNPAIHQYYNLEDTVLGLPPLSPLLYEVDPQEVLHRFHPDLPCTLIWGYNGLFPSLTCRVYRQRKPRNERCKPKRSPGSYAFTIYQKITPALGYLSRPSTFIMRIRNYIPIL